VSSWHDGALFIVMNNRDNHDSGRWLVFRYSPAAFFSLKMSRATSTAGKTLLTPTPYAVKMAFLDAALRHGLTQDPNDVVHRLARVNLRIGVPQQACVTGIIQSVRQERSDVERKRNPGLPLYRGNIAVRELVHYYGAIGLAFDLQTCSPRLIALHSATPRSKAKCTGNSLRRLCRWVFIISDQGSCTTRPQLCSNVVVPDMLDWASSLHGYVHNVQARRSDPKWKRRVIRVYGKRAGITAIRSSLGAWGAWPFNFFNSCSMTAHAIWSAA